MKTVSLFMWLLVPAALWAIFVIWGSPHIALNWRFHDNGNRYDPLAERYYTECTYFGALGAITMPAKLGSCPWVRFFREDQA